VRFGRVVRDLDNPKGFQESTGESGDLCRLTKPMKLVLLVADKELCAKCFKLIVEDALCLKVHCVKDGISALEYLNKNQPNLIHMDIQLPTISGWETIDRIEARAELDRIPICVVSVSLRSRDFEVGRKRVAAIRAKPVGATEYTQMVLQLLSSETNARVRALRIQIARVDSHGRARVSSTSHSGQ